MAPSVTIDNMPDFDMDFVPPNEPSKGKRSLLLAPPSLASHPDALSNTVEAYNRELTDIQMLDRLEFGLASLPTATYDLVLILAGVDRTQQESPRLLDREIMRRIAQSLKPGGELKWQQGAQSGRSGVEQTEAILAGLIIGNGGTMIKPDATATQAVKLSFVKKKQASDKDAKRKSDDISTNQGALATNVFRAAVKATPAGVGFIENEDDLDKYDDDVDFPSNEELQNAAPIDVKTLLSESDRQKPLNIPDACKPNTKRRRACKDCTCGLAQRLVAEDKARRAEADASLAMLSTTDLTEVDFTVQGKVGSCGNCALGDAFRCDGCPYIGLPAFKPGEEVLLLNNDVQL